MSRHDQTTKLELYPKPREIAGEEQIYGDLELPISGPWGLPYVLVNMVSSVDGRSSVGGRVTGIGSRTDRGAMRALRSHVDAVMVGSGTLRAEKLSLGLDDPDARQPLAVVVAGTGDLPIRERLVGENRGVVLAVPEGSSRVPAWAGDAQLTVLETPVSSNGRADLGWLLGALKSEHAVDRVLVEGGPTLNRSLIEEGLADELFLTIAPKLLLGPESSILSGGPDEPRGGPRNLTLLSAYSADDELFLRYRLGRGGT